MSWGQEERLNVGWRCVIMAMMTYMEGSMRRISCSRMDKGKMVNMEFTDNEDIFPQNQQSQTQNNPPH